MELWILLVGLSLACLIVGMIKTKSNRSYGRRIAEPQTIQRFANAAGISMSRDFEAPIKWNEEAITFQLQQIRRYKPALIPHFLKSVTERFIVRQDDHTAQIRLQFLRTQIEQLKLTKEFQLALVDLHLLRLEVDKRYKTLELETETLDDQKRSRGELTKLADSRDKKKLELEIVQLDHEIINVKKGKKETDSGGNIDTPEVRRRRIVKAADELDSEMKRSLIELSKGKKYEQLSPDEQERYDRIRNTYKDLIDKKYEELERIR